MECFTAEHWPYAVPGIILLVVFVVLSARLMSVGGELASIEMTANPLNWRGDSRKVQKAYVHALSARSTAHASVTVAVKTVAVFATTFMGTKHPVIVAAVRASGPVACSRASRGSAWFAGAGRVRAGDGWDNADAPAVLWTSWLCEWRQRRRGHHVAEHGESAPVRGRFRHPLDLRVLAGGRRARRRCCWYVLARLTRLLQASD